MIIGHVTAYFPPCIGGMEQCVYNLAKEQQKEGHEVFIFTSDIPDPISLRQTDSSLNIIPLKTYKIRETPFSLDLIPSLLKHKIDILHLHISAPYFPEIGALISKIKRIPYVAHVHLDPDYRTPFYPFYWLYLRLSTHLILNFSDAVIVPTKSYKELIGVKYGEKNNVFVVPNGVNFDASRTLPSAKGDNTILHVGRINPQKGLDLLIIAMKKIIEVFPDSKLEVIGKPRFPSEEKFMKSLRKMVDSFDLNDHIFFRGNVSQEMLLKLFSEATVFVAPSRFESLGVVLLEAMASGVPIVASNIPEFRETAGNVALLVNASDPDELANAVMNMLCNEDLRQKSIRKGTEKVRKYTWKRANKQILSIYKRCLRKNQ